jgi:uncharacterized protein (TIGR02145 family)
MILGQIFCIPALTIAQHYTFQCGDSLLDERDDKLYATVELGNQCWMAENLNYGRFENVRGGEGQPGVKHCYENNPANCKKYGALYTWNEVNGNKVCPSGWHVPGKEEWQELARYLGVKEAGQKIKSSPTDSIPWDGTNETALTIIPSGAGNGNGFHRLGQWALFWTSTQNGEQHAWFAQLDGFWYLQPPKYKTIIIDSYYLKTNTFSVRCVRDPD